MVGDSKVWVELGVYKGWLPFVTRFCFVEMFNIYKSNKKLTLETHINWKSFSLWLKTRIFWPRTEILKPKPNIFSSTVVYGLYHSEALFLHYSMRIWFFGRIISWMILKEEKFFCPPHFTLQWLLKNLNFSCERKLSLRWALHFTYLTVKDLEEKKCMIICYLFSPTDSWLPQHRLWFAVSLNDFI